jgi:hypothetical protein
MNIDKILETFNRHEVDYLLIGGVNFLLRHSPVLTYDVDLWIDDTAPNRDRCEKSLAELQAEWGTSDPDWGPVAQKRRGWISRQGVFCLTSHFGAIDIFRTVKGLASWTDCRARSQPGSTAAGVSYFALSDADMLQCQLALPAGERNQERIRVLKQSLGEQTDDQSNQ